MKRWKKLRLAFLLAACIIAMFGVQAQAKAISTSQVTGIWDGQYTGAYGKTLTKRHLTFVISKCTSVGSCSGIVYVSEASGSSYQVNGSYYFSGTVNMKTGAFRAKPGSWKKKVSNFETSYFSGTLNASAKTLKGYRLDNFNDTRKTMPFSLKKISTSKTLNRITVVTLNKSSASMKKGSSITLKYSYMPSSLKGVKISWSSSNSSVAKVSGGKVTALKAGTATITCKATYKGKSVKATCKITVSSGTTYTQTGTITNATTGKALASATINFRKGYNNKTGTIYKKTTTNSKGRYSVKLAKGNYTMQVKKSGYITSYYNLSCTKNNTNYSNNASISKNLASGTYRIVLTWGETPRDLDSHLTGPLSSGGRFHVYFPSSSKNAYNNSKLVANLDVDDTTSYGPETVTLYPSRTASGTYHYYVYDYTNRNASSSTYLAKSKAKVVVYKGSKQVATYTVPTTKGGNLWHVFDIVNGSIKKVNTVGYTSTYSSLP